MNFIDTAYSAEALHESENSPASSADTGLLSSLGINISGVIFQFLNFIIVSLIIWFLILKPITKKMTERQKLVDDSLKNADEISKRLTQSQIEYQARIDEAKIEANKLLEIAHGEAEKLKEEMKASATKEIESLIEHAKKKIQSEKEIVLRSIKLEAADLISLSIEKILHKKMDISDDKALIQEMLDKMK